jgi:hypothetical protein
MAMEGPTSNHFYNLTDNTLALFRFMEAKFLAECAAKHTRSLENKRTHHKCTQINLDRGLS